MIAETGSMMRKFSWMLLVLLIVVLVAYNHDGDCCGPSILTAIPPSGSQVTANAIITLVFDQPSNPLLMQLVLAKNGPLHPLKQQ